MKQVTDKLNVHAVPLTIPIGAGNTFEGVIDLVTMKALSYEGKKGETVVVKEISEDDIDEAKKHAPRCSKPSRCTTTT